MNIVTPVSKLTKFNINIVNIMHLVQQKLRFDQVF